MPPFQAKLSRNPPFQAFPSRSKTRTKPNSSPETKKQPKNKLSRKRGGGRRKIATEKQTRSWEARNPLSACGNLHNQNRQSKQTMTASFYAQFTKNRFANPMSTQTALQTKIVQEMADFQKMVELHLLKKVSRDLRKFKMMAQLQKFD